MSFLKRLFGAPKLNGEQMARSPHLHEYGQIELLCAFTTPRPLHPVGEQQRWSRALPQSYEETLAIFRKQGWLEENGMGHLSTTPAAQPIVESYRARLAEEKAAILPQVRRALEQKDTSEALALRRAYEARYPLGQADWTGPEPQLSHSALTRRIFFLEHWLLDGLQEETVAWLKLYAAEQHLWGAFWQLEEASIPDAVRADLAQAESSGPHATANGLSLPEAAYWKAYQLALYVDNQETWQRCKGGDHVRRIALTGPDDDYTCDACRAQMGAEFLVARVPELPHRACTSIRGCRCRYEPVLESTSE